MKMSYKIQAYLEKLEKGQSGRRIEVINAFQICWNVSKIIIKVLDIINYTLV